MWILIILLVSGDGQGGASAEFNTKQTCLDAAELVKKVLKKKKWSPKADLICAKK